jgi:hypothetical protein
MRVSMTLRAVLVASRLQASFLLASLLLAGGSLRAETPEEKAGFPPKLIIYLAKGPPNSCGPGCDHWIAIEGKLDQGAAARIRRFLLGVKDTRRPIYLYSPGGSVGQSFTIGRLLRSRKAIARIGRTLVAACAAGTQIDDACLKIKSAGGEVEAEITTYHAMCNSACGYLFLGATTREVAPDAVVAVHSSKLTLTVMGHISAKQIEEIKARDIAKSNRERAAFIAAMGISHELDDLITTVKFENLHILTRAELYRFGVDSRQFAETTWTLERAARPYVHKRASAKKSDGAFRSMEWRLFCEAKDRARLMFVREFDQGAAGRTTVVMMGGSEKSLAFGQFPARTGSYEVWSDKIASDFMTGVLAADHLQMGESTLAPDGTKNVSTFDIDTSGLQPAWAQLVASCQANPPGAQPATPAPGLTSVRAP